MDLIRRITGNSPDGAEEWKNSRDEMLACIRSGSISDDDIVGDPFYKNVCLNVSGQFCYMKRYKDHYAMMHLDTGSYYGVYALTSQLDEMMPEFHIVTACLIPFEGKVVCDGLIQDSHVSLGNNYIKEVRDGYWEAKKGDELLWVISDSQRVQIG
jgi:hypothetical protein